MDIRSACSILEIPIGSSGDDVSKAFRKKAAIYHPDKETGDIDKFKEINEAFQLLQQHGTIINDFRNVKDPSYSHSHDLYEELKIKMNETFNYNNHHLNTNVLCKISFIESVLGTTKEIVYSKKDKCERCNGRKFEISNKKCGKCDGKGHRKYESKDLPCITCKATGYESKICESCKGNGLLNVIAKLSINIAPGTLDGKVFYYERLGNYVSGTIYEGLSLTISVELDKDMLLDNKDIVSEVTIGLLEALKGTKISVRTIKGDKTLKLKPGVKNGDIINVSGYGVPPNGSHVITINVDYPDNIDSLIQFLENQNVDKVKE